MKLIVYGLWSGLGILLALSLFRLHVPLIMWFLIYGWSALGGIWTYLSGKEEGATTRRARR